jgi:hypothetical protein
MLAHLSFLYIKLDSRFTKESAFDKTNYLFILLVSKPTKINYQRPQINDSIELGLDEGINSTKDGHTTWLEKKLWKVEGYNIPGIACKTSAQSRWLVAVILTNL